MKKIKIVFSTLFILSAAIGSGTGVTIVAHADDDASTTCTLSTSDFAALQAIQNDPSLTSAQELSQELALRKQLLAETINCAQNEAQALQQTLQGISTSNGAAIQSQLEGKINDSLTFYGIESAKIGASGISGTEAIARELTAWRTANYAPLASQVDNFILWSQNQSLFQTAASRVAQTSQVIGFIEAAASNSDLQKSFNDAQAAFQTAASQNVDAQNALEQSLPPDQSLQLIQQSLQSLADAYQKFSDLNTAIQKLLPTNQ